MPVFLELMDLDQIFHSSKTEPIIINTLSSRTEEDREYYNNLVKQTFTSDIISMMPKCECGELKGEYRIGEKCPTCHTKVKQSIEEDINPTVWFRRPANVEKLINPMVWIMLNKRFMKSRVKVLEWLVDRSMRIQGRKPQVIVDLENSGIPRGYNSFVQNFDQLLDYLFNHPDFRTRRRNEDYVIGMLDLPDEETDPLRYLIQLNRNRIFSDYIPIFNRSLLVLDIHVTGRYLDETTIAIKDTLNSMLSIDKDYYNKSPVVIENRTGKIVTMLAQYYEAILAKNLTPKEGLVRQHVYGTRANFSFRAVITSHESIHDHDEIHVPWCVGMTTFQPLLLNKLMDEKREYGGMSHNDAVGFIYSHIYKYHPLLDHLLKEMIAEFPGGYIPCLNQRNKPLLPSTAM